MLAQARGQLSDAYRYGAQALATVAATGFPPAFMLWSGFLASLCHHTEQTAESLGANGITHADAADQDWPLTGIVLTLGPATQLAEVGRLREASQLYRRLGPASDWQESPHAALFTWTMGIATATTVGANEDVAILRSKLGAYRGHHIVNGRYAMAYFGPAELWLGVAEAYLGLVDEAVTRLDDLGMRPIHAKARALLVPHRNRPALPADPARARGGRVGRAGTDQPTDRRASLPLGTHGTKPRTAHPRQARSAQPQPDRGLDPGPEDEYVG
jgi:hypothetical protein